MSRRERQPPLGMRSNRMSALSMHRHGLVALPRNTRTLRLRLRITVFVYLRVSARARKLPLYARARSGVVSWAREGKKSFPFVIYLFITPRQR